MGFSIWIRAVLIFLLPACIAAIVALFSGQPEVSQPEISDLPAVPVFQEQVINTQFQSSQDQRQESRDVLSLPLSTAVAAPRNYRPKYEISWAHPLNYGERYTHDIYGKPVFNQPLVVLHETVYSATSALNHFQTPHVNEEDQASYHTLIKLDGTVVYIVPPEKRAFGAANSVFKGSKGPEAVKTHAKFPASVNNFAYHVSLETPSNGRNRNRRHSGYTNAQYQSLAWLIAQSKVPDSRITTHRAVDRSGNRMDPRSFNRKKFLGLLHSYRPRLRGEG